MLSRKRINTFDASEHVRKKRKRDSQDALTFKSKNSDVLYVFVDTETTGINHKKDKILQIAATSNKSLKPCFNPYILPSCPMGKDVMQSNGLHMHKGHLQRNRKAVCADHCQAILENFLAYLDELKQLFRIESLVIVAHLASFDMKFLCMQFFKYDLWERFKEMVCGVVDTLDIFPKV